MLNLIKHSFVLNGKSFKIFSPNFKGTFRQPAAAAVFKLSLSICTLCYEVKYSSIHEENENVRVFRDNIYFKN